MCESKDDVEDGTAKTGLINQGKDNVPRPSTLQAVVTARFPPMSGVDANMGVDLRRTPLVSPSSQGIDGNTPIITEDTISIFVDLKIGVVNRTTTF